MKTTENLDPKNVSAFMVHHVLRRSTPMKPKRKKKLTVSTKQRIVNNKKKSGSLRQLSTITSQERSSDTVQLTKANSKTKPNRTSSIPELPSKVAPIERSSQNHNYSSFEEHFRNKTLFEWMISPINCKDFMSYYWEKKPLHIIKNQMEFSVFLSTPVIDQLLTSANIQYTKNLDITFYENGVKELHNLEGRARSHVVWDFYCNGCSVRMLNPQTFVPNIHKLTSELQEFFGCFVGCNAYLTPPNSQGFAPHYDDIEAFILQIEGRKCWRVYEPRSPNTVLPRFSSGDFVDVELGQPVLEIVLNAGDVLYLPRGYIHQAITEKDFHSLHITISAYQCNAWVDLIQKVVPKAIENAWKNDIEFRKGLPLDYLHAAGLTRDRRHKKTRTMMKNKLKFLCCKLADYVQVDWAVDQLGVQFMHDALPPVLTEDEKLCSVYGGGLRMMENGYVVGAKEFEFNEELEIVLLRKFASRLLKEVKEYGPQKKKKVTYRLYYTTDNSLEYHGEQTSFSIVPKRFVPCIQFLFQSYPNYVTIKELPHSNMDDKINLVADLWERGIIRSKNMIIKKISSASTVKDK